MTAAAWPLAVISLDRTPERWRAFQLANAGLGEVERVSAVDGRTLDRSDLIARGLLSAELDYSAGALGCALSHAALWRRCLETGRPLTVFEDDAILRADFARASAALAASQPGFDLILWGWNFDSVLAGRLFADTPFAMGFDQGRMRRDVAAFQASRTTPTLLRLHRALGTPGYTISPGGAQALLARCFPLEPLAVFVPLLGRELANTGIDVAMNAAYPEITAFAALPPLVLTLNDGTATTVGQGG